MSVAAGWYPDPTAPGSLRWWDGQSWTAHSMPAHPGPDRPARSSGIPWWTWLLIGLAALVFLVALAPLAATLATVVLITALVGLRKGSRTWLRFPSRRVKVVAAAGSTLALFVSGSAMAALPPSSNTDRVAVVGSVTTPPSAPQSSAPQRTTTTTRTPTPTPTLNKTTRKVVEKKKIAFTTKTVKDPKLAKGKTRLTQVGKNGERTKTYRVTEIDGVEVGRDLISDVVTTKPVTQVKTIGTYVAPAPRATSKCDSNYAGACVPIASDVDCAGGSGNGPRYFSGVARVVGSDVYDLDRDNDGYACETD